MSESTQGQSSRENASSATPFYLRLDLLDAVNDYERDDQTHVFFFADDLSEDEAVLLHRTLCDEQTQWDVASYNIAIVREAELSVTKRLMYRSGWREFQKSFRCSTPVTSYEDKMENTQIHFAWRAREYADILREEHKSDATLRTPMLFLCDPWGNIYRPDSCGGSGPIPFFRTDGLTTAEAMAVWKALKAEHSHRTYNICKIERTTSSRETWREYVKQYDTFRARLSRLDDDSLTKQLFKSAVRFVETVTGRAFCDIPAGVFPDVATPNMSASTPVAVAKAATARGAHDIPPFDRESGEWVKAPKAAEHEAVETPTLAKYRSEGETYERGLCGIDCEERKWRKAGPHAHVWYLRSSLRKK